MKKPKVDTPYKNSWADQMATGNYKLHETPVPIIFINEQKLIEKRRSQRNMDIK